MGAPLEPARGGKRRDAHLNLVPYVDVMMTILAFLILTAAWTQTAALEVQTPASSTSPRERADDERPPPVVIRVGTGGIDVGRGAAVDRVPLAELPDRLAGLLRTRPDAKDVVVHVDDGVGYAAVAHVVDVATGAGLVAIELRGAGA